MEENHEIYSSLNNLEKNISVVVPSHKELKKGTLNSIQSGEPFRPLFRTHPKFPSILAKTRS